MIQTTHDTMANVFSDSPDHAEGGKIIGYCPLRGEIKIVSSNDSGRDQQQGDLSRTQNNQLVTTKTAHFLTFMKITNHIYYIY